MRLSQMGHHCSRRQLRAASASAGNNMTMILCDMSCVHMVKSGIRCTSRSSIHSGAMRDSCRWKKPHTHINLLRRNSSSSIASATHATSSGGKASSAEGLLNAMDVNIEGPPRFFCPLDAHKHTTTSRIELKTKSTRPLIIYLPGIDGTGLAAYSQFKRLGMVFDLVCFSIPTTDRTPFDSLVNCIRSYIEFECEPVRKEGDPTSASHDRRKNVIVVGESFGGLLACAVALQYPQLVDRLCLVNPATSFEKSIWSTANIGSLLTGKTT